MLTIMTKARKCCCTPEPYKHLFYLALYWERAFPQSLRDSTSAKEHIHTKYVQVPEHIGSEVILRASPQDLRAYREFLLPPRTQDHPVFDLENALQWVDPAHFWAFVAYGAQGFDTSGRCSYCEFFHAFKKLEKLEKRGTKRGGRTSRPGFFKRILSHVGTPARAPTPKAQEVAVAC